MRPGMNTYISINQRKAGQNNDRLHQICHRQWKRLSLTHELNFPDGRLVTRQDDLRTTHLKARRRINSRVEFGDAGETSWQLLSTSLLRRFGTTWKSVANSHPRWTICRSPVDRRECQQSTEVRHFCYEKSVLSACLSVCPSVRHTHDRVTCKRNMLCITLWNDCSLQFVEVKFFNPEFRG